MTDDIVVLSKLLTGATDRCEVLGILCVHPSCFRPFPCLGVILRGFGGGKLTLATQEENPGQRRQGQGPRQGPGRTRL